MEVIPRPQQTDNNANQELQESHLRSLPSFINLQYTFQTQTREYFVLDHVDSQRNLASMYKSHGPFRHDVVVFLAAELLIALEYLHAHNTVYCELNMKKVFIDVQGHVKLSRTMSNPFQWTGDECFYCNSAQSNCQNEHHGSALVSKEDICHDWVTLGGLLCKLLTGKCPLSDVSKEGRNERRG